MHKILNSYDINIDYSNRKIIITDLKSKPEKQYPLSLNTKEDVLSAISETAKRDLPVKDGAVSAITGAFGYYFLALAAADSPQDEFLHVLDCTAGELLSARPPSVNLFWCLNRMYYKAAEKSPHTGEMLEALHEEAKAILCEIDDIMECISADTLNMSGDRQAEIKDIQVVELLLFFCFTASEDKLKSIRKTATALLDHFGSLHDLFEADPLEICSAFDESIPKKTGQAIGILISAIPNLHIRYQIRKLSGETFTTPQKAAEYIKALLYGETIEHLYLILLDKNRKLLDSVLIGKGTIDSSALYPREFVRAALKYKQNAEFAILAHNHPSGSTNPSPDDENATVKAKEALRVIGIKLVDHIIIAGEGYTSFAETGTPPFN